MPGLAARAVRLALIAAVVSGSASATGLQHTSSPAPASTPVAGFDRTRLADIDTAVATAIAAHQLPGAVVLVGRGDTIVWKKAYGDRALVPAREPMTIDTIFDLASLTKVVATTPSIMRLVERGQIRLADPVVTYIPQFAKNGKSRITIRDLMTHMSGLAPDLDLSEPWTGADTAIARAADLTPMAPPGRRFVYSDVNFILLGEIVRRVTHQTLDVYAKDTVFAPLGMKDTTFLPPAALAGRIAPTQSCDAKSAPCTIGGSTPVLPLMLRGVVHDPTSRRMGGVAGHAGVFSTAADLAIYCRMLLDGGAIGSTRVLAPLTIERMTSPATPEGEPNVRGLGWDLDSTYSSNRGDLLSLGSFGHTGFTGTSIWIDPATRVFVVFLSNRVHPDGTGDVTPLRSKIASIVAGALVQPGPLRVTSARAFSRPSPASASAQAVTPVQTGVDVLRAGGFKELRGLRVGLLTNLTGRTRDGVSTIDVLASAPGVKLVSLFSPEHGIRGALDASVPSTTDEKTGVPIHSLYGATERPTAAMLDGIDAVVIDLQDIGARFYTYMTSMAYVMEECAKRHVKVVVLDRPNPIGGDVEGPALDPMDVGFTGYMPEMPIRHGLTIGELARVFNGVRAIGADLTVVPMANWRRDAYFDETGLEWVNPSPNMRSERAAILYPGIGAFEGANISVGRGTDTPFEHIGAPWIDGVKLADALNARRLSGVRFYATRFTPSASVFANQECQGVAIVITDRASLKPVRVGVEIASALVKLFPGQFKIDAAEKLFGSKDGLKRIAAGEDPGAIAASWTSADNAWIELTAKYLLYR